VHEGRNTVDIRELLITNECHRCERRIRAVYKKKDEK